MIPPVIVPLEFKEIFDAFMYRRNEKVVFEDVEKSIANYNTSKHAIFTTSGRSSLYILLNAYGLKAGDEIAMPAYMCSSVSDMLNSMGFKINFIDIDSDTYNISIDDLTEKISNSTKCIIPTHMFGNVCNMKALNEIANDNNSIIIEDSAQTMGSEFKSQKVGTFGDSGFFSFGRGKPLTCMQGGAIVTDDDFIAKKCRQIMQKFAATTATKDMKSLIKMIGYSSIRSRPVYNLVYKYVRNEKTRGDINSEGMEFLNSQFHAKICLDQLTKIDDFNSARKRNAQQLYSVIRDYQDIITIKELTKANSFYLRYPIQVDSTKREEIMRELLNQGIEASVVYPVPLNLLYDTSITCKNTEDAMNKTIALPIHPLMKENDISKILSVLEQCRGGAI